MKHEQTGGSDRNSTPSETNGAPEAERGRAHERGHGRHGHDRKHGHHGHHHGPRGGGRAGARIFDYGELRLLLLAMLAEQPRHGYELIKSIEERLGGSYTPSPGVIYPTLSWLEDMTYATVEAQGGRKLYSVTPDGEAFLAANRTAADDLLARGGPGGERGRPSMPAPVLRAMENLKVAMRLRLKEGPLDPAAAEAIAAALDEAARAVESAR